MEALPRPFFLGGQLWIDFVNTRPVLRGRAVDLLPDLPALLGWLEAAAVLDQSTPRPSGRGARQLVETALRLREGLAEIARRFPSRRGAPEGAIAVINEVLGARQGAVELSRLGRGRYALRSVSRQTEPLQLLEPVALSAAAFLCFGDPALLLRCEGCVLYFQDATRNHRRRYCSPALCGNRLRVAAFRARRRRSSGARGAGTQVSSSRASSVP